MNFIVRLSQVVGLLASTTFIGNAAEFDPPATDIAPAIIATVAVSSTAVFEYSYTIANGSTSAQGIGDFALKLGTVSVVQNVVSPPGWVEVLNTIGTRGLLSWGAIATVRIKPGTSVYGFSVFSANPPDVRDSLLRGFVPMPAVDHVDENTPAPRDIEEDSVRIQTIGPGSIGIDDAGFGIDRLISLKHRARDLAWISSPGMVKSLDAKLDAAKVSVARGQNKTASNQLSAFISELTAQRGKTVNDSAFHLLKTNAEFIIGKLEHD
jgi:hypothetical protein